LLQWKYHIAPAVAFANSSGYLVLDPALFDRPVVVSDWLARFNAVLPTANEMSIRAFTQSGAQFTVDDSFGCTNEMLLDVKEKFYLEILGTKKSPPYRTCP
jgi:hypothetical protein